MTRSWSAPAAGPAGPAGVAVSRDGSKVYLTSWYASSVAVIDTATDTVTAGIRVGNDSTALARELAVNPDGSKVYVTITDLDHGTNTVSVIGTATNRLSAMIPVGGGPGGVASVAARSSLPSSSPMPYP